MTVVVVPLVRTRFGLATGPLLLVVRRRAGDMMRQSDVSVAER